MTLAWYQYTSDCHVILHKCGVTFCSCSLDFIYRTLIVLRYAQNHLKYDSCGIENIHFSLINQINLCYLKRPSLFVIVHVLLHSSKIWFTALFRFYFESSAMFILYRSFFFGRHVFTLLLCHSVYIISHSLYRNMKLLWCNSNYSPKTHGVRDLPTVYGELPRGYGKRSIHTENLGHEICKME